MNAWAFAASKLSSKSPTWFTRELPVAWLTIGLRSLLACLFIACPMALVSSRSASAQTPTPPANPTVLFDSYHAHNFLDRGLIPGEHAYHHLTGLRRATELLRQRRVEVGELIIGPITPARLGGVKLIVVNLPSVDRPPWLVGEIDAVVNYVRSGGGIIFVTDHSNCYYHQYHLLPLWERLGLTPTFETVCEREPSCRMAPEGEGWLLVRKFQSHPITESVRYFSIQTGGRVVGQSIIAQTSPEAWADAGATPMYAEGPMGLYGDMRYSDSEESGSQGIVLARNVGQGRVVVISDQNALGDMQISYADNWRLWLNACQWAGGLKYLTTPSLPPSDAISATPSLPAPTGDQRPNFEVLLSQEPDRNAQPQLPKGTWQVECWEPLARGGFHWGGNNAQQLHYFWCWLNRWTWTSAHEGAAHPQPNGRPMLLAVDSDLADAKLVDHARDVLARGGKLVVLPAIDDAAKQEWRDACLKALSIPTTTAAQWQTQPLGHWQISSGQGTIILIPEALQLRNASFERPERAPSAPHAKWLGHLYRWLFEQP